MIYILVIYSVINSSGLILVHISSKLIFLHTVYVLCANPGQAPSCKLLISVENNGDRMLQVYHHNLVIVKLIHLVYAIKKV